MRTGGRTWLIEGSVRERRARTLHENVECPSLSPDGTRVAYKKRVEEGSVIWRLHVLDLRTMEETPLAESRTVDDQAEWLDDGTVLYGLDAGVWAVPADGGGAPRRLLSDALSPAVL
jgi:Tol biopolymer transport system component